MPLMPIVETNLKQALTHLQARYFSLSAYGKKLAEISRAAGKPIPATVLQAYGTAREDYMRSGRDLFAILDKKGMSAEQVLYRDGAPVPDPRRPGHVKTIKVNAPLRPPAFAGMAGDDLGHDEVGIAPLVLGLYVLGGIVITGLGGYFAVKALEQIKIMWRGPDYRPDQQVDAYIKCVEKLKASGASAAEATEKCTAVTKPPPSSGVGLGVVLLAALGIGGAVWISTRRSAAAAA